MSKKDFKIFYSWQSDKNSKYNNYFIKQCLEKVVKDLSKDASLEIIPRLDKDVQGKTGSPNIADTIFKKIDACQIMVADVTLINDNFFNRSFNKRLTPNPNVLIELGYGLNRLSWERIICLNNSLFSKVERLPFDLKQNRISQYRFGRRTKKEEAKKQLTDLLKHAINEIIQNYDLLEEKERHLNVASHDRQIFDQLDKIIGDDKFINLIQFIANNSLLEKKDYKVFDQIDEFLKVDRNKFLIPEVNLKATEFRDSLVKMHMTFAKNVHSKVVTWIDENGEEQTDTQYTFSEQIDYKIKDKKVDENIDVVQDTILKYKEFRQAIKRNLLT